MLKNIDVKTVKQWLDTNEAILIDIRESYEYSIEHVEGALTIPVNQLTLEALPITSGKKIIIQCHSGSGQRSKTAYKRIMDSDLEIYNVAGGFAAWKRAKLPTIHLKKTTLSIERQLFLVVGIILLLASGLTYFVNSLYILLIVALACGLIFSALSGWCMLNMLISKMPWNQDS